MRAHRAVRPTRRFGASLTVVALVLSACGSGGDSTPDPAAEVVEGGGVAGDESLLTSSTADPDSLDTPLTAALPALAELDPAALGPVVDLLAVGEGQAFTDLAADLGLDDPTAEPAEFDRAPGESRVFDDVALGHDVVTQAVGLAFAAAAATAPAGETAGAQQSADTGLAGVGAIISLMGSLTDRATPGQVARSQVASEFGNDQGSGEFSMSLGLGRDDLGRTVMEMGMDVSATAAGGGTGGRVAFDFKTEVNACPDPDGVIRFELELTLMGEGTSGGSTGRGSTHVEGTVEAHVDDAAFITSIDMDLTIEHVQRAADGRDVYVEVAWAPSISGGRLGEREASWQERNQGGRITRHSSKARQSDADALFATSSKLASQFVMGFLAGLQVFFRDGRCVQVLADAPASTAKQQAVAIAVSTRHKLDKVDLTVPVDAQLTGAGSLDTRRLPNTPGTLTYTSGTADGDVGTIDLVSTSRRGIGRLSLTIGVAATRYAVSGGGDGLTVSGEVGRVDQPFSISGTFPGADISFDFTPTDATSGTVTGAFSGSGVSGTVEGPYTISGEPPGTLTLTMTTSGCVGVGGCRTNTSVITLTPIA